MSYQFQQWWAKTGYALWRDHKFTCGQLARRAYAAGAEAAIPPGWKLVPVEATDEMLAEFWPVCTLANSTDAPMPLTKRQLERARRAYLGILATAPTPPERSK